MLDQILFRISFVAIICGFAYYFRPLGASPVVAALGALILAVAGLLVEKRIESFPLKRLLGASIGALFGILSAFLIALVLVRVDPNQSATFHFFEVGILLSLIYFGVAVGANKGDSLNLSAFGVFGGETGPRKAFKILDTSVIIDGRIADIAETGFLEGALVIPQFVLRELQLVADSADSMKRNRGRRGLDVLQRLQKIADVNIQIVEEDFPQRSGSRYEAYRTRKGLRLQNRHQ